MGAAFLAPGQALVDAVAVSLVGDDEDAAVGVVADAPTRKALATSAEESRMERYRRMRRRPQE